MKLKALNKILSVSLIIIMVSHLTFLHNILQDYVLCNGANGHIAVENIEESIACSTFSSFNISINNGQNTFEIDYCEDTPLDENCIEESEFIPKDKVDLNIDLTSKREIISPIENEFKNYISIDKSLVKENQILGSYTTVSLLI